MTKEDIEKWCIDNNFILIELESIKEVNHLIELEVKKIAENICKIDNVDSQFKGEYAVFSRWLFWYYFSKFSDYTNTYIGEYFFKDHATVGYGLKQITCNKLNGWRLSLKIKFEHEINRIHKEVGIKRMFK